MNGVILGREVIAFKSYPYDFSDLDFLLWILWQSPLLWPWGPKAEKHSSSEAWAGLVCSLFRGHWSVPAPKKNLQGCWWQLAPLDGKILWEYRAGRAQENVSGQKSSRRESVWARASWRSRENKTVTPSSRLPAWNVTYDYGWGREPSNNPSARDSLSKW